MIDTLKNSDEKAYRVLYNEYCDMLCILAYHFVKDTFLAESLFRDVIYNLWKNRGTLQIHTLLKVYKVKYHMKNTLMQLWEQLKNYLPVLTIFFLM